MRRIYLILLALFALLVGSFLLDTRPAAAGGPSGSCNPSRAGSTSTVSESESIAVTNGNYWTSAQVTVETDNALYVEAENSKFFLKVSHTTDAGLGGLYGAFVKYEWDDATNDEDVYAYIYTDGGTLLGSYHNENAESLASPVVFRIEHFRSPLVSHFKVFVNGVQVLYEPADYWALHAYYVHSGWRANYGSQIGGKLSDIMSMTNNLGTTDVGSTYVTAGHPADFNQFGAEAVTGVNNPYGWYLYDQNCPS